jgi:hypothetical protein
MNVVEQMSDSREHLLDSLMAARSAVERGTKRSVSLGGSQRPKGKKDIANTLVKEQKQFEAVMNHPAVMNDPFGTIQLHLKV